MTARTEEEVSRTLQRLEEAHRLLEPRVEGWCAWPVVRLQVGSALQGLAYDRAPPLPGRSRVARFAEALRDLARCLSARPARVLAKTYTSVHGDVECGRRKDVYLDDLLALVGPSFKLEWRNQPPPPEGYFRPPDAGATGLEALARRLVRPPSPEIVRASERIAAALRGELGSAAFDAAVVARELQLFVALKRAYRLLLVRVRPEHLLVVDSGAWPIVAAAKELGARVTELQHGFTHRHYPGSSWTPAALPHKGNMPIPDRILTYGAHWGDELRANGFWGDAVVDAGSPRVDAYRVRRARPRDRTVVVFTAQALATEEVIAFLAEVLGPAPGDGTLQLVVKTHPARPASAERYAEAFRGDARVRVVPGGAAPTTFDLLAGATAHASIFSTCHYEALALGVPTILLPFPGHELVAPLCATGHAFAPRTPTEMRDLLARLRHHEVPPEVGHRYFAPDALGTMVRELAPAARRAA